VAPGSLGTSRAQYGPFQPAVVAAGQRGEPPLPFGYGEIEIIEIERAGELSDLDFAALVLDSPSSSAPAARQRHDQAMMVMTTSISTSVKPASVFAGVPGNLRIFLHFNTNLKKNLKKRSTDDLAGPTHAVITDTINRDHGAERDDRRGPAMPTTRSSVRAAWLVELAILPPASALPARRRAAACAPIAGSRRCPQRVDNFAPSDPIAASSIPRMTRSTPSCRPGIAAWSSD